MVKDGREWPPEAWRVCLSRYISRSSEFPGREEDMVMKRLPDGAFVVAWLLKCFQGCQGEYGLKDGLAKVCGRFCLAKHIVNLFTMFRDWERGNEVDYFH